MKIAMITVLYGKSTYKFMNHLEKNYGYLKQIGMKIFIIDNGNHNYKIKDDSSVVIIKNRNTGFSKSINLGLRKLFNDHEYALVVNPDLDFEFDEVLSMTSSLEDNFAVIETKEFNQTIAIRYFNKITGQISNKKSFSCIEFFNGPAFSISRKCFKKLDGFDERYFLYFEDLDFSIKLHSHNIPLNVIKSKNFVHHPASSSSNIGKRERIASVSGLLFTFKHMRFNLFLYIRYIIKYLLSPCRTK
tara:strand:+ start:243 stop:977 length:735 start_codon:yes stop_codon:yes gene_type:complete